MCDTIPVRPDLEDYEFYDPQSMQRYAYYAEEYMDYLESLVATEVENS